MAARLGIVTQGGWADFIKHEIKLPYFHNSIIVLVFGAIVIGNAAYEGGNIGGGMLGLEAVFGTAYISYYPFINAIFAFH